MKTSKSDLIIQRKLIERKVRSWTPLRSDMAPPTGWIKAIRGSLGMSTQKLADRLGVRQSAIVQFEQKEAEGKISLETIQKVARALGCRMIYAIVPDEPFPDLESILDDQAERAAREIVLKIDHTMKLERQGVSKEQFEEQVRELASELKAKLDPALWSKER